ncbi:ATP-binding protein [Methylobacterium brachythecii]|uniref:histidine kinase n=1 Tax=Methylobacterium brachythecii TaxID=1176177 RepID=A0A7W6ARB5_9HYPH|nr:ATP-binding protein [Methylobacterium brachythecii]MBB3904472.1 signal transduction histidine kinase/DNA-binding response OmpR family regulator [Methylobacterium brachythecii]
MKPLVVAGELVGWLGSAIDIEPMVRNRRALEETSHLLRLSQEAAGAGLFDVRFGAREIILSPVSARLHGLAGDRPAVISIADWLRRVHPADRMTTLQTVRDAVQRSTTFDLEFRVRLADGAIRWIQAIGRPCDEEAGAPQRVTGLNLDISARKETETTLIEAKRDAEAARLAAERANAAKTEFLSAMSHELRTPLNAVIGFSTLLAGSERLDGDLQRYAELVRTSGANLLGIVNDVLDFSAVEAGAVTLNREAFGIQPLIEGCLAIVGAAVSAKTLDIASLIDNNVPERLLGDEARLQQVLLNLLNNAVKFTQSGSVTVSVRHKGRTPWGERVSFRVIDTGIGIAADKQQRLFERFYQVDSSIQRDYGGTGLGLAISKKLVERMGGEIGVTSTPGRGSTFWFTLTLPRAHSVAEAPALPASDPAIRPGRILLVEDIDINRELASVMLRAAGHTVEVAENGFEAVRAVQIGQHDLVLMDIQMPGMDGLMATRLIRCLPGDRARVPIVAMTANVLPNQVQAFREAGLDDHLGKPFSPADLDATLRRWLGGGKPGLAPETAVVDQPTLTIDRAHYEHNLSMLPSHSVSRLLGHLGKLATESFSGESSTRAGRTTLRREAHALASGSGLIGFSALSQACATLDGYDEPLIAEEGLAGFDAALAHVRRLAAAAASETQRLIADMEEPSSSAVRATQ